MLTPGASKQSLDVSIEIPLHDRADQTFGFDRLGLGLTRDWGTVCCDTSIATPCDIRG